MRLEGTREIDAPREAVFRALTDPELVADALPGVGRVEVESPDRWHAEIKVPLAARAPRLRFSFQIGDRVPPERARLEAHGKTLGSSVRVETSFELAEREAGTTMSYVADVRLGGLLGRLGDGVAGPAAKRAIGALLNAVERRAKADAGASAS